MKLLAAAADAADKKDAAAIFSHVINLQDRWFKRLKNDPSESAIEWWGEPYAFEELGTRWKASLERWLNFLSEADESELERPITYRPEQFDNGDSQMLRDIVLHLNYHSILHREGIAMRLRDQGLKPPFVDYLYYLPPQNEKASAA